MDKYGQFNTAHYLIECPITSKNCQYVREMLNDDELDVDITSQGDILRTRLYRDPQLLLEAIASRPPMANCVNNHVRSLDKYIPTM